MVFEWKSEAQFHRVPKLEPGPVNVYFSESAWETTGNDLICTANRNLKVTYLRPLRRMHPIH